MQRHSWPGSLYNIKHLGFQPATVIDVGAGVGTFDLYHIFPEAKHLLLEPREEDAPHLEKICTLFPNATYLTAAAGREPGSLAFPGQDGSPRTVPMVTLDQICVDRHLIGPYLLKVDVDGPEVDVLSGATRVLQETEYAIIEMTLFNQFYDVMDLMRQQGFVAYDIVNPVYRMADGALSQVDIAFVKAAGAFRQVQSFYADDHQKAQLTADLEQYQTFMTTYIDERFAAEMAYLQQAWQAGKIVIVCS
ncbi:hypothetical protein BST81_03935 [Leptolyngbya sp. 'hensonii']|nr:hypothetical protein BST81_03935 [Leptolyngbya sp. 'hensonii']